MKRVLIIIARILVIIVAAVYLVVAGITRASHKPPENSPQACREGTFTVKKGTKTVVCMGDSITHGRVSINYVDILSRDPELKGFTFINAGINSRLAWNLVQVVDEVAACKPDVVTILIGTNDANATLDPATSKRLMELMELPEKPTQKFFRENLAKLCSELKKKTSARIAFLSLPPIGEDPPSIAYKKTREYSMIIKSTARKCGAAYLPLNETMDRNIRKKETLPHLIYESNTQKEIYITLAKHHLLRKSLDEISRENGLLYLTDLLHLNTRGAETVAGLIKSFLVH